jgi:carbamoyl-phosphate synthase small subunit
VTTREPYTVAAAGERRFSVAALDLGIKANTPRLLAARGIETRVLPSTATIEELLDGSPDGVFLSNGPGDPATADHAVALTAEVLRREVPLFGICFGNQILGRALGLGTFKLPYGHRGLNVPVIDHTTGTVAITSQNHGFAVAGKPGEIIQSDLGEAQLTHVNLYDGTVEGIRLLDVPAGCVQYHPEAGPGPNDSLDLFDEFIGAFDAA